MKKLSRNNLKEIKAGSGDIGAYCGKPRIIKSGGQAVIVCDSNAPVYHPKTNCCMFE